MTAPLYECPVTKLDCSVRYAQGDHDQLVRVRELGSGGIGEAVMAAVSVSSRVTLFKETNPRNVCPMIDRLQAQIQEVENHTGAPAASSAEGLKLLGQLEKAQAVVDPLKPADYVAGLDGATVSVTFNSDGSLGLPNTDTTPCHTTKSPFSL